ncbi:MAG: aminotransferase class I/II-fold pyridoxal phosphate-dependent enzyme [Candidatus Kariarchaeaceae archaeon]
MGFSDFLIERYYAKYEFSTQYMLSSSDAESWTVDELLSLGDRDALMADFANLHLGYTESQGDPELRELVSNLYTDTSAEQVLMYTGAEEAIFSFVHAVLQPGDHIIVMFPAYQSLYQVAQDRGIEVSRWECDEADSWRPSIEQLEQLITEDTRAVVINTPHNPTGFLFSHDELDRIITICKEHDIILFSDEVYRYSEYDPRDRLPSAVEVYEKAVTLGVMSKPMGLPGLRVGWIATRDPDIYRTMQHFKDYVTICGSAPSEFLATVALRNFDAILERNVDLSRFNLKMLREFMNRHTDVFQWEEPRAGNIAFVRLLLDMDVDDFCDQLREQQEVLLLPSSTYEYGHHHFRIGYGRKNFAGALRRLELFVLSLK